MRLVMMCLCLLLVACGASAPVAPTATPPLPKLGTINGDQWLAMSFDQRTALMTQALHDFIRCPSSVNANDLAVVVTQQATIKKAATDVATILIDYAMGNGCVPAS